ncbi:glycoside hydrolase family 3 protein [Paenibacillus sp. P22]|uniref:glycoside hydrolase family 3 protein n=1 Tax=Paenibacillus sp. P22 TaxID=483908 RepID=UPI0003FD79A5|nr:glycoside hydrolase family 3 protein [Paenibacillus sp. P22]
MSINHPSSIADSAGKPYEGWLLKEKIAQLFIFGFHGKQPSDDILGVIRDYGVGGVIYFSRNVQDARQVHELSGQLGAAAAEAGRPPLLVSIDQEGGMVARIVDGVTLMPGNMALGATGSEQAAYETARISGEELRKLGINLNLAPCLDVNNNPDNPVINVRSFGDRPELVSRLGAAAVRGYQAAGVSATVKHFPGHGDTSVDSHHDLPVVPHDRARLDAVELPPFKAAIEAGTDLIMTAHICLPSLDSSGVPSTLSKPVLTGLLRGDLGYEGVIVTDCLEMDAIDRFYGPGQGSVKAIEAGADLLLVSHTPEKQLAALEAVAAAVENGQLDEARIDESLERILALKDKLAKGEPLLPWEEASRSIFTEDHRNAAERWSEASVTLVKNEGGLLPLPPEGRTLVLWPEIVAVSVADEMLAGDGTLGSQLQKRLPNVEERRMSGSDPLAGLERFDCIVFVSYDAMKHPLERTTAERLMELAPEKTVAVSVRNPLDINLFPDVQAYLAVYECRPLALQSAAKALAGELKPSGRLPMELSAEYPFGFGL